jgi:LPXTG-motif cell wall-anchored protein
VRLRCMSRFLAAALLLLLPGLAATAQTAVGGQATNFKDTSILKPPPGAKVAVIEFEDLECPACARAFPIVHEGVQHYKIPLVRHDFPLPMHIWSRDAADLARYIQDKVSPDLATEYRREVFASQYQIASKDDLHNFSQKFLTAHGQQMPFALDPVFDNEVMADKALGDKLGLAETPTIIVVTNKGWIQVKDVMKLYEAIDQADAMVGVSAPTASAAPAPADAAAPSTTDAAATPAPAPAPAPTPTPVTAPAETADSSTPVTTYVVIGAVVLVLLIGGFFFFKRKK